MTKIYSIIFLCIFTIFNGRSQEVFQASVLKGFSLQGNGGIQTWKSTAISENMAIMPAVGIGATFGFSESIFAYFRYQNAFKGSLSEKEIDFNIFSKKVKSNASSFGLGYAIGKPSSKLKYYAKIGVSIPRTTVFIYDFNSDLEYQINLKGTAAQAAIGALFYLQPFLSIGLECTGDFGKYNQSEFLGLSYKEKLKFIVLNPLITLNYHFNGR